MLPLLPMVFAACAPGTAPLVGAPPRQRADDGIPVRARVALWGGRTDVAGLAAADLDGDGTTDLIAGVPADQGGGIDAGGVALLPANVSGSAPRIGETAILGRWTDEGVGFSVAVVDADHDGVADLLVSPSYGPILALRGPVRAPADLSVADLGVTPARDPWQCDVRTIGDVDGDGFSDWAVTVDGTTWLVTRPLDGVRPIEEAATASIAGRVRDGGDLDGDGRDDLIVLTDDDRALVFRGGSMPASFTADAAFAWTAAGEATWATGVGDANGDGAADLAFGPPETDDDGADETGSIAYGPLAGPIVGSRPLTFPEPSAPDRGWSGDVDGDGSIDVVLATRDKAEMDGAVSTTTWFPGAGGSQVLFHGTWGRSVVVADLTGDGLLDVADNPEWFEEGSGPVVRSFDPRLTPRP